MSWAKRGIKKTIRAEGVVAWSRPNAVTDEKGETQPAGMGIMFAKIFPFVSQEVINDLVKKTEGSPDKNNTKGE